LVFTFVEGDILTTRAQVIGLGHNAQARHEDSALHTRIAYAYPAALSAFRKQARAARIATGDWWLWREATPWLGLLVIRSTSSGATRLRHVEEAAQQLIQASADESVRRVALARLGEPEEWSLIRPILLEWLAPLPLQVVVYEIDIPGRHAPEPWDAPPPGS
jgi:hypothetical protein